MTVDAHASLSITADQLTASHVGSLDIVAADDVAVVGGTVVAQVGQSANVLVGGNASVSAGTVDVRITGDLSVHSPDMSMTSDGNSHKLTSASDATYPLQDESTF